MSERTIITTIEITDIQKNVPECFELNKEEWGNKIKKDIEGVIDADGVVVAKVQEFQLQGLRDQMDDEFIGGNEWIPVSERLPEEEGYCLITIKFYHLHNPIVMGCNFENGEWWNIDKDDEVIAWMPLPEPFKPKAD